MRYSDEELLRLDPELEATFKKKGWPKIVTPNPKTVGPFRKGFTAAAKRYNTSPFAQSALGEDFNNPRWTERDQDIPVRDGGTIRIRTYTPKHCKDGGVPVVVQMHGGGWFMGDLETDQLICQLFCAKLGVAVVNVDFRLYPEVSFGVPSLDCYDAVRWVATNASSFGGDPLKGFIVAGNSGGGTFASIAAHLARDDGLQPPLTGCFLTCPIFSDEGLNEEGKPTYIFDRETEYRSWWQNKDAPLMNDEMRQGIAEFAEYDWKSPLLTPFNFRSHRNIPATYMTACGLDPWRDGAYIYQRELEKEGSTAKVDTYPGLPHCWWTSYPQISATQIWLRKSIEGMEWVLSQREDHHRSSKL